jgi:hypothetical protein
MRLKMTDYSNGVYPNLRLKEVDYGFGWHEYDNPSTDTISNILERLDTKQSTLTKENNLLKLAMLDIALMAKSNHNDSRGYLDVVRDVELKLFQLKSELNKKAE